MKKIIILAISLAGIVESQAETWTGKVLSVQSGDRLTVQRGKGKASLRVAGIEAPAPNKRWGKQSRASLSDMCLRRPASVKRDSPSSKEASVACQWAKGYYADMSAFQVEQGWAKLAATTTNTDLVKSQLTARHFCRGLWVDEMPTWSCPHNTTDGGYQGGGSGGGSSGGGSSGGVGGGAGSDSIVYKVGGTAYSADLLITTPQGDEQHTETLPFTSEDYFFNDGDFVYLAAQNDGTGSVTVSIYLNGKQVKTATSTSSYGIASVYCVRGKDC